MQVKISSASSKSLTISFNVLCEIIIDKFPVVSYIFFLVIDNLNPSNATDVIVSPSISIKQPLSNGLASSCEQAKDDFNIKFLKSFCFIEKVFSFISLFIIGNSSTFNN